MTIGWELTEILAKIIHHGESAYNTLYINPLPPIYSIWIFTHLKFCLADAIHKWVKIMQIWQNGGQKLANLAD